MTTTAGQQAQQDHGAARPPSVTDATIERLLGLVSRGAQSDGTTDTVASYAPYDLSLILETPSCTPADVQDAVDSAHFAQQAWKVRPLHHRADIMLRFHDLLLERQDELLDLIQWETGKSRFHAYPEIVQVANLSRHYANRAEHYLGDEARRGFLPGLTSVREARTPKGVVGVISPWNYPFYLAVGDALPALLAGNGVVSKADSQTPLTLLWARELFTEAGLPADLWHIVVGPGSVVGTALIESVDFICFTGSTRTGRTVAEQAGRRLIGCSLELGGKNPMLVCEDADVAKAAAGAVHACFSNAGQMCISMERMLVHENVYDDFVREFLDQTAALKLGQTYDYSVDVGCLVSPGQLKAVSTHVDEAVSKGAKALIGGMARPDVGPLVYEPTVLEGVTEDMRVCGEETFGPVVSVYPVESDAEAVHRANEGNFGLNASVWTRDRDKGERLARQIKCGTVNINDGVAAAIGSVEAPMGGMRDSGLGRRHGAAGIQKYTEPQTIATQRLLPLIPAYGISPELYTKIGTANLKLLRRLGLR